MFYRSRRVPVTVGRSCPSAPSELALPAEQSAPAQLADPIRAWHAELAVEAASDSALMDAALQVEQARRALDAACCQILGELDARGSTDQAHGMHTARWLAHHAGIAGSTASSRLKVARRFRGPLREAGRRFDEEKLSFDHAKAIVDNYTPRIADSYPGVAALFADHTEGVVFDQWRSELRAAVELLDADGAHDPADDVARNRLTKAQTIDQTYLLDVRLVGTDGLLVHQAIDQVADELFHRFANDEQQTSGDLPRPGRAALEALALVEICRRASATDVSSTRSPGADVTLVVNAGEPEIATDPSGVRLQDRTTRHLLCDARLLPVVVDSLGVPLDLGRAVRLATAGQRRAMAQRDGGCVFPGCTSPPSWSEAHHIVEWASGGDTDLSGMASLCRHHHGVVHRTGWNIHATAGGRFWFRSPTGCSFWGQRHRRQATGPIPDG